MRTIASGQHEDEDGTIVNPGGNVAPGLNRGEKMDKPANPNKPEKPNKPGSEDKEDKKANKAQQGTHIYTYDELNRMVTSDVSKVFTNYTYDTLGNLVLETVKNKSVDYEYNELNQLVKRTTTENETFTYSYDKRGNRVAETGKKESREYVYDATNRLVEGTNWKGDKSAYTYNGLGLRVNNLVTTHAGKTYDRDYVIDYTSPENDDLYVYAMGNGQLEYEQRHVYAGSERLEQITEKGTGGWERTLYVHEDVMGNTRYYTKATGQNFAELQYDAWGQPVSPNKLVNNNHGNYVFATFTGHIYDTTLDVYFAEARFYDAITRTWMAMDPIKSGLNWYSYVAANPTTFFDPFGTIEMSIQNKNNLDVEGDGEPSYAYVRISPESFAWFAGFTVVDTFTLGIPTIAVDSAVKEGGGYSALFEEGNILRDVVSGFGPEVMEKAPDVVDTFSKTTVASHMGENAIGKLLKGANWLKEAAPIVSMASAVASFANLADKDRVLNDDAMLSMMAEAGWIVESKDGSGQAVYFADPQKRLSEKEQLEYFDDLVEQVKRGYAFFETEQAEFFRTHSTFNKAYSMASDYEIYMSIRNLPAAEREKKLQDYLRTYEGKLLGSFYAENDSIELTASQRNDLNLLLREYKQRLNTLDERYREAFHAFRKFVCG